MGKHQSRASPGRKAGCGLKLEHHREVAGALHGITRPKGRVRIETPARGGPANCASRITRPKGRVRIETTAPRPPRPSVAASPGRKAGCGLKLITLQRPHAQKRAASPGRKAGCGLKPANATGTADSVCASPGRKAGCGLKPRWPAAMRGPTTAHHPAERPGAD